MKSHRFGLTIVRISSANAKVRLVLVAKVRGRAGQQWPMLLLEQFGMVVAAAAFAVASRRSRQELAFVQLLLTTWLVV